MALLRAVSGPAAGQTVEIAGDVVIGREGPGLVIDDTEISRRHAVVRPTAGGVEVEDLGSMNGTLVNGERITGPVTMSVGGKIQIGDSELHVELAPSAATRSTPVAAPAVTRVTERPRDLGEGAPPPGPAEPPAPEATRGGRSRLPLVLGALVLLAGAGVALALALGGDSEDEATPHAFKGNAAAALVTKPALELTAAGFYQGRPLGRASVLIDRSVPEPNLPGGPAVPLDLKLAFRADRGSIIARFSGTIKLTRKDVEIVRGRAKVTKGTGDFEGATGSFTLRGDNVQAQPISRFALDGTVEY